MNDTPACPPSPSATWASGPAPVAAILISLNEGHNMEAVLENLSGWAREVFLVDSYSRDDTVDIALRHGVHVVQHRFRGYGEQWNFALENLPIRAPWTLKIDPDERISEQLKVSLLEAVEQGGADGFAFDWRLWFMGTPLPVRQPVIRMWRTGCCRFSDTLVNEHPVVSGRIRHVRGCLEHYDSPDLDHWVDKQNRYTTADAVGVFHDIPMAATPRLAGTSLERRMWLKRHFVRIPFRYPLLFLYNLLVLGAWRAGDAGFAWASMRCFVMLLREYKCQEMETTGKPPASRIAGAGEPDPRVPQYN